MALKVADTFVAIGGDLTGYRKALGDAKTDVKTLASEIRTALTMKNPVMFGGKSIAGNMIADLRSGIPIVRSLQTAAGSLGGTLKGLSVNALHTGLSGVKNVLGGLKGAVGSLFQGLGIGAGIVSFEALGRAIGDVVRFIPDLISRGQDYGNLVDQIGDSTGATAEESSRLAGTLEYLGAPTSSIVSLLGQMARNLEDAEPRLKALGVTTRDANGGLLNQVQILENARQAFSKYGDGTAKADQIAREFGRGGLKILVDYLKLTDEQAKTITDDLQAQGLIISESQRNMAETAMREGNRFQGALTGLGTTLFTIVGPQITAFMSNLSDTIAEHTTEISNAVGSAVSFILGLVSSLVGAGDGIDSFSAGIARGNAVVSPYSTHLFQLTAELANLDDTQKAATDSSAGQRKAIQGTIDTIGKQIAALKLLETQQDKTYKRALDGLYAQLDAQNKLLDAEDAAAAAADRDLALTKALREAKIGLFEAQAQLRADALAGKSTDQDTLNIARAQAGVLEAQKAIADESKSRSQDARRAELASVKDYIAEVAKLLEDADNKKAALANFRTRQAVLEARKVAQLAAGDTTGAGDTGLRIDALKAAEVKAQEEIANATKQTALEAQKAQLQEELSNISTASADATAIRKREIAKQIRDLEVQQAAWDRMTNKQKADILGVTEQITKPGGLTPALEEARKKGIEFGKEVKKAIEGITGAFGDLFGLIGKLKDTLDTIANSDVWKWLTNPVDIFGAGPLGNQLSPEAIAALRKAGAPQELIDKLIASFGSDKTRNDAGRTNVPPHDMPEYASGLWQSSRRHAAYIDKGETVLPPSIASAFRRAWSPQVPAMALAGAGGAASGAPVHLHFEIGGRAVVDYIDEQLSYRTGRSGNRKAGRR